MIADDAFWLTVRNGAVLLALVQLTSGVINTPAALRLCRSWFDVFLVLLVSVWMVLKYALIGAWLGAGWFVVTGWLR